MYIYNIGQFNDVKVLVFNLFPHGACNFRIYLCRYFFLTVKEEQFSVRYS